MTTGTVRALAAAITVTFALTGCAAELDEKAPARAGDTAAFPVTVGALTLESRPERMVILGPTATEMLFSIRAGGQVAAVDEQSNLPPEAPKSELSAFTPNSEAIRSKKPDFVVLTSDQNDIVDRLTQWKIPHHLAPPVKTLDDAYRQITELGSLTGHRQEAAELARRMRADIAKITDDLPQRSEKLAYFYELGPEYHSATSSTFVGSLFTLVGLENIADPADAAGGTGGYPQLSEEAPVAAFAVPLIAPVTPGRDASAVTGTKVACFTIPDFPRMAPWIPLSMPLAGMGRTRPSPSCAATDLGTTMRYSVSVDLVAPAAPEEAFAGTFNRFRSCTARGEAASRSLPPRKSASAGSGYASTVTSGVSRNAASA